MPCGSEDGGIDGARLGDLDTTVRNRMTDRVSPV